MKHLFTDFVIQTGRGEFLKAKKKMPLPKSDRGRELTGFKSTKNILQQFRLQGPDRKRTDDTLPVRFRTFTKLTSSLCKSGFIFL